VRTIGGKKLSVFIDSMRIAKAKELGCKSILLKAEKFRVDSLKKIGFTQVSPPLEWIKCPAINWILVKKDIS